MRITEFLYVLASVLISGAGWAQDWVQIQTGQGTTGTFSFRAREIDYRGGRHTADQRSAVFTFMEFLLGFFTF